jgi:uncharacterized membrane protein
MALGRMISVDQSKSVWYKTWWGALAAIFFIFAVFFLIWAGWAKPKWLKIEDSNCIVALFSVGFTYIFLRFLRVKSRILKLVFGLFWLLFLPNTAYLFHRSGTYPIPMDSYCIASDRISLFVQYLLMELFVVMIFFYSCLPFEKIIERVNVFKKREVIWLILFNFLVAFGMVLGRFEHINSHVLFINPLKVLGSVINIFVSFDLLGLTFLYGLLCNIVYFLFRGLLLQRIKKYFRILD